MMGWMSASMRDSLARMACRLVMAKRRESSESTGRDSADAFVLMYSVSSAMAARAALCRLALNLAFQSLADVVSWCFSVTVDSDSAPSGKESGMAATSSSTSPKCSSRRS